MYCTFYTATYSQQVHIYVFFCDGNGIVWNNFFLCLHLANGWNWVFVIVWFGDFSVFSVCNRSNIVLRHFNKRNKHLFEQMNRVTDQHISNENQQNEINGFCRDASTLKLKVAIHCQCCQATYIVASGKHNYMIMVLLFGELGNKFF